MTRRISLRDWNRTLLSRQFLLERIDLPVLDVLDRCVGLQSQEPQAAFIGLWSRIEAFRPAELDQLMTERRVVRMASLRSTVFLMATEDARWVRPVGQPALDAELTAHAKQLRGADPEAIVEAGSALLTGTELSVRRLGQLLGERWPHEQPSTLAAIVRAALPLVQVPPRGLWRRGGATTYRLLQEWAPPAEPAYAGDDALRQLIRLYLRGFGPSTVTGIQTWARLTKLTRVIEAMLTNGEIVTIEGPEGERLFDLPGMAIIDGDTPAPVRLLAPFDNVVVAQADRRRIVDSDVFPHLVTANGRSPGFVLVDGRVVGAWKPPGLTRPRDIEVTYLTHVSPVDRRLVTAEVDRLNAFCRA
jgi:DNA glycosylase AlkZ-like